MSLGFARSIYLMLGTVFLVIPGAFGFLIWNAYRVHRRRAGEGYRPSGEAERADARDPGAS